MDIKKRRRRGVIVGVVAGLAAVGGVWAAGQPEKSGVNPAVEARARGEELWVKRNEGFNARARQGHEKGDIGVVFLGDSITEGWEGAGREVWKDRYEALGAVNFGIGGDRTQHVLWRVENGNLEGLAAPKTGKPPRLAVLMIGTNNLGGDTPEQIAGGIAAVVEAVNRKLPATPVLVLGVFPRGQRVDDPARGKIAEINHRVSDWVADRSRTRAVKPEVEFLDIGGAFLEKDGSISAEVMPDSLHLSPRGYRIWGEQMAKSKLMTGE
jgi:lysophospholipase L1-like esterase